MIVLASFHSLVQNCVEHYSLSVTVFNILMFLFVAVIFTILLYVLLYNILLCCELIDAINNSCCYDVVSLKVEQRETETKAKRPRTADADTLLCVKQT